MPEKDDSEALAKGRFFFERARKAAKKSNFDFAIDMYLEGLRCVPDTVDEGHIKLRELALVRKAKGGQKPSPEEISERQGGETAIEQMVSAECLLAKDPGHLPYAEALLKAAVSGGYNQTAKWIGDLVFLANNNAKKPSLGIYVLLKDSYVSIGQLARAVAACRCAVKLEPDDEALKEELARLTEQRAAAEGADEGEADIEASVGIVPEQEGLEIVEEVGEAVPSDIGGEQVDVMWARARDSFERARQVAEIGDFDYAIDLYLKGLRWTPDALEEGHLPLCELGLQRQRKGGKKPSMMDRVKRLRGKTPLEQMLNAEYLFARDPDNISYGEGLLKATVAGGYTKTANWIANYVFQANNNAKKPSLQTYVLLKDSYAALGQYDKALAACQRAARLKPEDDKIADDLKNLTAEVTVSRGRYDTEGDFRQSIKDRESQERLHAQESIVKTEDYRVSAVEEARKALVEQPDLPRNIYNLAQALSELQSDESDAEAMKVLEDAYEKKSDFSYKQRAGQIRIRQLRRKIREAEDAPGVRSGEVKSKIAALSSKLNDVELEHFRLCVENYPTDLQAKYEHGVRLMRDRKHDEAIPLFQEAQKDPRHKIAAMGKIGFCFFKKGWFADAVDVLTEAIESYAIKDDAIAKELRYNLARSYEKQGNEKEALEIYRKIAQLDFSYKDVRTRVDKLRSGGSGASSK